MMDALLKAMAPAAYAAQGGKRGGQPWGSGYTLSGSPAHPFVVKCAGTLQPNPEFLADPQAPAEILVRHDLAYLVPPEGHAVIALPLRDDTGKAISNEPDDSCLTLAPGVTLDPNNPICPTCGQPPVC